MFLSYLMNNSKGLRLIKSETLLYAKTKHERDPHEFEL